MKIKTYTAKDMRQALRQVREEQGLDAVILSTRHLPGGVEVAVAIDADGRMFDQVPAAPAASEFATLMADADAAASVRRCRTPGRDPAANRRQDAPSQLGAELRSMRHLLERQLAQLAWNDLTRRAPGQAELLKELTELWACRGAGQRAAGRSARWPRLRRCAAPMPGASVTTHRGHRRFTARHGRPRRLRRPDGCRQDHRHCQACRALGHAPRCACHRAGVPG